ncbi:MAG: zinc ABC transporter substrate-binding protein [Acidimicrobiia bacterium]|nr:zinc ABC transporter substrate-binding protein [Acidimicrobiia bacterium]
MSRWQRNLSALVILAMLATACGSDDGDTVSTTIAVTEAETTTEGAPAPTPSEPLEVIATTTILGDLVANVVGSDAEVEVLLPPGADPHDYQISSSDAARIYEADLVVANGLSLEEGILAILETAEEDGVNVLEISNMLDPIPYAFDAHGHGDHAEHEDDHAEHDHDEDAEHEDDHADHDHDEDAEHDDHDEEADHDHEDEADHDDHEDDHADHDHDEDGDHDDHEDDDGHEGHDHGDLDPHFWTDPIRVGRAGLLIAEALAALDPSIDWQSRAEAYAATMAELDEEIQDILATVPEENRKLITNHDSLGYFADRYDFEVIGTIIPSGSTLATPSSSDMANLIMEVIEQGIPAIFAETIEPTALAEAIAEEVGGDVVVVTLLTGSLGEPGTETGTIVGMLRHNARLIAEGLS